MNRKLNNSLFGLAASGALLVVGLVLASPTAPTPTFMNVAAPPVGSASAGDLDPAALVRLEAIGRQAEALDRSLEDGSTFEDGATPSLVLPKDDARALPAPRRGRAHRQTLVMPYFSFAPRG